MIKLTCECFSRIVVLIIFIFFAVLEFHLIYYLDEHYWLIPAFVCLNVIVSWCLLKYIVLKSFLFSYAQGFIVNRELKLLNE